MGHGTLEWVYVGVVVAVLIYIGADAWNVERFLDHAPEDAQVVKVTGQQWFWTFEHEDGKRELGELHLVKGVPYRFEVTSLDVNHSFNPVDFAMMIDAIPGRINSIWFVPDQAGEFLIQCREYCGFSHYQMRAKLFVEEPGGGAGQGAQVTNASATTNNLVPPLGAAAISS
jgi:cytochrome c oxidase subunit II